MCNIFCDLGGRISFVVKSLLSGRNQIQVEIIDDLFRQQFSIVWPRIWQCSGLILFLLLWFAPAGTGIWPDRQFMSLQNHH